MNKEELFVLKIVPFLEVVPMPNQFVIEDYGIIQFDEDLIIYTIEALN